MRKILRKKYFLRVLTIAVILLCGVAVIQYFTYEHYTPKEGATVGGEYVSHDEIHGHIADESLRDSDATNGADSTAYSKYHTTHGPD